MATVPTEALRGVVAAVVAAQQEREPGVGEAGDQGVTQKPGNTASEQDR
ncbi:hypothetical protein ACLESD_12995 [Pyxidicoccus sp. 3LFB2]